MGTRADFYVGRGPDAEWIGSIGWDGYPDGIASAVLNAVRPKQFRAAVERFFAGREDVTRPADGWPWPWDDSCTTDYAYAFDAGKVYVSRFGSKWVRPRTALKKDWEPTETGAEFPDMEREESHDLREAQWPHRHRRSDRCLTTRTGSPLDEPSPSRTTGACGRDCRSASASPARCSHGHGG